jgi:hypothetical protein
MKLPSFGDFTPFITALSTWIFGQHPRPPVDVIFTRLCGLTLLYATGHASPVGPNPSLAPMLVLLIGSLWSFFIHANVRWRLGPLEEIIAPPSTTGTTRSRTTRTTIIHRCCRSSTGCSAPSTSRRPGAARAERRGPRPIAGPGLEPGLIARAKHRQALDNAALQTQIEAGEKRRGAEGMAGSLTAVRVLDHSDPACLPPEAAIVGAASGNRGSTLLTAKPSASRACANIAGGEGFQAGLPNLEVRRASNRARVRAADSSFAWTVMS